MYFWFGQVDHTKKNYPMPLDIGSSYNGDVGLGYGYDSKQA